MAIFQKSVIKKHLNNLDKEQVEKAFLKFRENYTPTKIEQIKKLKEEEYQDGFLREIFVDVLGYTLRPSENFDLQREYKNQTDGKKADGAILKNENAIAVIELKSAKTKDLTLVTQQAFNYKNNQPECKYVITSNFQKLRFYIDYSHEYEEFDLFHLEREEFELLFLILRKESIFSNLPIKLKEETQFHDQNISAKLYKDYSNFKRKLYDNLTINHPEIDKLTLFKKSQKLIDRFLFILFAEDSGLLPPNSISRVTKRFAILKEEDSYKPLYEIFKQYFGYMNVGRKGKKQEDDIPAYNGGLFYEDELLNALNIDDALLISELRNLSMYDFNTEIDVNILGHIFEHSLNEIEEVSAEIQGTITDNSKSKRKKDGVFYTPKYITQYIVENTIGTLCHDKRKELDILEIEFEDSFRTKDNLLSVKGKNLYQKLTNYKDWLINLKIIDPACGSGAFLNQALNFLIAEHTTIDDIIAELTNAPLRLFDVDKNILENNLFGVDINEESVEIAQLSLWLRTARKDRKLSSLNNNIKCGNSLLTENFDWHKEFPDIMKNGGFDVVIGNPPYIKEYTNRQAFDGLHEHYCYQGKMDLWYFFGTLALEIVKKETGLIGYIAPNNWITNSGASKFRNIVINNGKLIKFIDFGDFKVFDSAGIQTMIYIMKRSDNNQKYNFDYAKVLDSKIKHADAQLFLENVKDERFEYFTTEIEKEKYLDKPINFINAGLSIVINKIKAKQNFVFDGKEIAQGIVPNPDVVNNRNIKNLLAKDIEDLNLQVGDGVFIISKGKFSHLSKNETKYIKPIFEPNEIERYKFINEFDKEIIYITKKNYQNDAPTLIQHLEKYSPIMNERRENQNGRLDFFHLHWPRDESYFEKGIKILSVRKCNRPTFVYTEEPSYVMMAFNIIKTVRINQKYLTGLLNSNLIAFWLKYKGKMQGDLYQVDKEPLLNLPIVKPTNETQNKISEFVSQIIENKQKQYDYGNLLEKTKTENNFEREIQLSKELENISKSIEKAENEINEMVYAIYGMTENEITEIENAIK